MVAAYTRLGYPRPDAATARELVGLLERREVPNIDLARRIVAIYEAVRFGGREVDAGEVSALRRDLRALGRPG